MDGIRGKAFFFRIDGAGLLSSVLVKNRQICVAKRHEDLPQLVNSGPLFLESRNFFTIPKQSKGALVAFKRLSKGKSIWKLGIVNQIIGKSQICEIFVWNGPIVNHSISDLCASCIYPEFYFWDLDDINSHVKFEGQVYRKWQLHFTLLTIDMDKFIDFWFLNQVDGLLPGIFKSKVAKYPDRVNKHDNCFEQSPQGYDQWILPKGANLPKLSIKLRPLMKDNFDTSYLPSHFLSHKRKREMLPKIQKKIKEKPHS